MTPRFLPLLMTFLVATATFAEPLSDEAFSLKMMHYFQDRPAGFAEESVDYVATRPSIEGNFRDVLIAFYAKCFQDEGFRETVGAKVGTANSKAATDFFGFVAGFNIDDFLKAQKPSPHLNDLYWAAYFASGDTGYLAYLLDLYRTSRTEAKNLNLFLAAGSAGWSLSSNSHQFPSVAEYLASAKTAENADLIEDLLTSDPSVFRQRQIDFVRAQHQKGVW